MATKNAESTVENFNLLEKQNDVASAQCTTAAVTEAPGAVAEQTTTSASRPSDEQTNTSVILPTATAAAAVPLLDDEAPVTTMSIDENESAASIGAAAAVSSAGGSARSSSSGGGGDAGLKRRSSYGDKCNSKRKTRRGKTKRGKRSSSARPYSKTQWKFQVPWTTANRRRAEAALGTIVLPKAPILLSDQPPLVPYNTNRFLMEDHMPHVLTPSGRTRDSSFSIDSEENYFYSLPEDEEEFLTKEFSSVYEDARSERLESLTKSQLIQEYLQLEANYEQITRRYNAVKSLSIREENESAVNNATTTTTTATTTMTKDDGSAERRRLEERVRELTAENLDLRRQLEHAARIGMVLSAKSSPRNTSSAPAGIEPMDSSSCSSEDSESDSSSSSSSDSSNDNDEDNDATSSDCSLSNLSPPPPPHNAQEAAQQQAAEQQQEQPMNAVDEEEDLEGELLDALKENGYHVHVFSPQREAEDSLDVPIPPLSNKASSSVFF